MKEFLSKFSLVIVVVLISIGTTIFAQSILYNGDFEVLNSEDPSMPDGWWVEYCNTPQFTTISIDDQVKHSGNYSFKFTTIAGKTSEDCVVMPSVDPDTMYMNGLYKISFWTKTEGAEDFVWSNMDVLWAGWIEGVGAPSDWTYIEAIYPYKGGLEPAHFLSLWFNADSCGQAGSAWFDDVAVEYLGTPPSAPEDFSLIGDYEDGSVVLNWGASEPGTGSISHYLVKRVKRGADSPNILSNPSFEDPNSSFDFAADWGTFYWSSADQQTWTEDTARTGDFSVTISSELGGHGYISQTLNPPDGTRGFDVYMQAFVKTKDLADGSGALIGFQDWYARETGLYGTNDWTASDAVKVNVLSGSTCALLFGQYFDGYGGWNAEANTIGQAWYDDVSAVVFDSIGYSNSLTFTDANVDDNETYYYSVRAVGDDGLLGDAQMATVMTTGGNLLYNGDFEILNSETPSMPDNWWVEYCGTTDVTTISIDDQVKHSGNYSFKFTTIAGKTSDDCVVMPSVGPSTVYVGGLYKFSYWVKTEGIGVYNIAVNPLGWEGNIAEPLVGTNDWTYREGIFMIPDWYEDWDVKEDHFLSMWFNADSCSEAGSAWYDDISVEYVGTPPSIPVELNSAYSDGQVALDWIPAIGQPVNPVKYYLVKKVMKGAETPNICNNPSFEDPNDFFTFPANWGKFYWASADMDWAEGVAHTGDFSVTQSATTAAAGHAHIFTGLYPPEGTRGFDVYMKTYIKTENISGGSGALIDFQGWYGLKTGLYGTNDWTADDVVGANVHPGAFCALMFGQYGDSWGGDFPEDKCSGQAWYDDVSIVVLDSIGQSSGYSFTDTDVTPGETYYYTVRAVDNRGLLGDALLVETETTPSAIDEEKVLVPFETKLVGNYPNPFNPSTTIMFNLDKTAKVQINVYNILGQKVTEIANREYSMGQHRILWDASSNISSGVYFYEMRTDNYTQIKKMILMR